MSQKPVRSESVNALLDVFAQTTDPDEIYDLLEDICTIREILDMSQRLEVARLLAAGESYVEIQATTGASTTTISRVSKCLNYGSGGYRRACGLPISEE